MHAAFAWHRRTLIALLLCTPSIAEAHSLVTAPRVRYEPVERRIELQIGNADAARVLAVAPPHQVTLHRIRVEYRDAAGRAAWTNARWTVELATLESQAEDGVHTPMVRLDRDHPQLRLPRPFGVRVAASDSLRVIATIHGEELPEGVHLFVAFEYESDDVARTRVPARAIAPEGFDVEPSEVGAGRTWAIPAELSGRLVAVAGPSMACADAIVLEDAESDAVLWRMRASAPVPTVVSTQRSEVVRPGVVLERGRRYRIRTEVAETSACAGDALTLMLVPQPR